MTTATAESTAGAPTATDDPADDPRLGTDPGDRGSLVLADRVVEQLAAKAATEVPGVSGSSRGLLGLGSGGPAVPSVDAHVDGEVATVELELSVAWPLPVGEVTAQVRQRVVERLRELAGITRAQVDITVTALPLVPAQERRVR